MARIRVQDLFGQGGSEVTYERGIRQLCVHCVSHGAFFWGRTPIYNQEAAATAAVAMQIFAIKGNSIYQY